MMNTAGISVIVCTYNRGIELQAALEALLALKTNGRFSYEIVVVDDASIDATPDVVAEVASRAEVAVRYVRGDGRGIAAARNRGVAESRGAWVAFTDDDQLTDADWLYELYRVALETGASCVGGNRLLLFAGPTISPLNAVTRSILGEELYANESRVVDRRGLPGTENMLIRKDVFRMVGLFDQQMLTGGSDHDLVRRVRRAGLSIWAAPTAVVYHVVPAYRTTVDYFRLASYRLGANLAYIDCKERGRGRSLLICAARIGQALFVGLPLLGMACLVSDEVEALGRKCSIWRACGYARRLMVCILESETGQQKFFGRLEFRREPAVLQAYGGCERGRNLS
jgi:GT2 family glycosyltransferase